MAPDANYSETFLRKFHAQYAEATSKMWNARTDDGYSSYELLAQLIPHSEQRLAVLDLACGDAPLLELLHKRNQPNLRLIGVDISPDELDLAHRRLGSATVDLRLERAQQLSLDDNSVDYILCHLALMLMDPVENAVSEIHRVLKPGGLFAAIVNGKSIQGDAWEAFVQAAKDIINQEGTGVGATIGDRRTLSVEGITSLLNTNSGFDEPIAIKDFVLHLDGSIEQVKSFLFVTYTIGKISPRGLETLNTRTMEILKALQRPDGTVPCSFGLRLVLCKKKVG